MKKNWIQWIFTAIVLAMCLAMPIGLLIVGEAPAGANEQLSPAPRLTDAKGKWNFSVLADGADWFADRFFPRQQLISGNNRIAVALFGQSEAKNVICGTDGWLYYAPTLADFTGTNPLTAREQFCIVRNVTLMAQGCENDGRQFVFCIAPNKNSLYPQHMPNYGVIAATHDAETALDLLTQGGVRCVNLFEVFGEQQQTFYFAHDTHWNSKGAALAADAINQAFGKTSDYFSDDFSASQAHSGDLYAMLYPAFADEETGPVYGGTLNFSYTSAATDPSSITLTTEGAGEGSLLAYRDSFGSLLYPYLADSFASARFSRAAAYDLTQAGEYVLVEIVERNLRDLARNVPVMRAPECTLELPQSSGGSIALSPLSGKAPEGMAGYRGTLPENADADSKVYLVCGEHVYEAFCLEKNGFAAYVDASQAVTGVAYSTSGVLTLLTVA